MVQHTCQPHVLEAGVQTHKLKANLEMSTYTESRTPALLMRRWGLEAGCSSVDISKTEQNTECGVGSGDLSGHHYHNASQNLVLAPTEFKVDWFIFTLPDEISVITKLVTSPSFCQLKI